MQEIIQDAKRRFLSQYGFTEYEPSFIEAEVVKATLKKLKEKQEAILTPKEISELIESEIFYAGDTPKQRAAKVGWIIKKFNLSSDKKPRTRDGVRYLFQKEKVENIYQSYFKIVIEPTSPTPKDIQGINSEQMMVYEF
jgi:hypothetical protein